MKYIRFSVVTVGENAWSGEPEVFFRRQLPSGQINEKIEIMPLKYFDRKAQANIRNRFSSFISHTAAERHRKSLKRSGL